MTELRANAGQEGWPPPVLDPAGPFAEPVAMVAWVLFGVAGVVITVVIVALALALLGPRRWRDRLGCERLIWIGGLSFPIVVLTALLIYGLGLTSRLSDAPGAGETRVRVVGEMWWWRIVYLDGAGREAFHDANEIYIPAGRPVVFELEAADVIHSFWIPRLGGKMDMIPGRRTLLRLQADEPGVYAGQCAEFCGGPHALMGLVVVALPPAEYEAWRARRTSPAGAATGEGAAIFAHAGCGACHTIRGTDANGLAGPDLTHVGSRRTLGAGILPNNAGTLAGWISNSQAIKPGNRMPAYSVLEGAELRAIALYLEQLK